MKKLTLTAFIASVMLSAACNPESKEKVTPANNTSVGNVASIECAEDMIRMEFEYDSAGRITRFVQLDTEGVAEELMEITYDYSDSGVLISLSFEDEDMVIPLDCTMDNGRITGGDIMSLITFNTTYDAGNYLKSFAYNNEGFGANSLYKWTNGCLTECSYDDGEEIYVVKAAYGTTPAVWGGIDLGWLFIGSMLGEMDMVMAPFGLLGNRCKYLPEKIIDDYDTLLFKPQFDKSGLLTALGIEINGSTSLYKVEYAPKED